MQTGVLAGGIPFLRGGGGSREAVVLFGVNALLKRLDRTSNPARYTRQVERLLPGWRFTILGYAGGGFDEILAATARAIPTAPDLLLGISFGGMVALRLAASHPDRVRRLVLLSSAHRFSPRGEEMIARQMAALERGDSSALVRENGPLFRSPWRNWLLRTAIALRGDRLTSGFRDPGEILRDYRRLFGPDVGANAAFARRVACPTMVLGSTADQVFDRAAFEETAAVAREIAAFGRPSAE